MAEGATEEKPKTNTLYIWGLDRSLTQDRVKAEFEKFAKVKRVTIIKDKETFVSKGFGYVECENPAEATKALKEVDGRVIDEFNPIRIKYSYTETPEWLKFLDSKGTLGERAPRGRGRGRGNGRGRGVGFGLRGEHRGSYGPPRWDTYRAPLPPPRDDYYGLSAYDDHYGKGQEENFYGARRPIEEARRPIGDRIPYDDRQRFGEADRMPPQREDLYARRPIREGIYDPPSGIYDDERPARRAPTDLYASSYGSNRDEIYSSPAARRDIYEERRDLYRPSDRKPYVEDRLDQPLGRSPDNSHLPPYRARSPADRPAYAQRDPYDARPPVRERDPYYDGYRAPDAAPAGVADYRSYEPPAARPLM